MDPKPPLEDEPSSHVRAKEAGALMDATVLAPFNFGLALVMALMSPAKKKTELKGF